MRHCLFCETPLGDGVPEAPVPGRRHAYDPAFGRLWEICPACRRWNPVPLELRWEVLEAWESAVQERGRRILETDHLALVRVAEGEVVRVDRPPRIEWGGWRYGDRLPAAPRRTGFLRRVLAALPPPPLGGYDPYALRGMGGVGGDPLPEKWLASPFFESASALTLAFTAVPFARSCPSCGAPMPLEPWAFQGIRFRESEGMGSIEAPCGACGDLVLLSRQAARPALRLGLSLLDSGVAARRLGESAGAALDQVGGGARFMDGLGKLGMPLGELERSARIALGMALDEEAEADALETEWREAEEIASIMDGELTRVPGFQAFRARVLDGLTSSSGPG